MAQEVERVGWEPERCWFDPRLFLPECHGVPELRHLALTAPDELGCRPAWVTPPSVCECVYEWVNVRQYCKAL